MAELIATSGFGQALPLEIGGVSAREIVYDAITSVAPFKGQTDAVSATLQSRIGAGFPAPGRSEGSAVWAGLGQCFVLGPVLDPIEGAAMTDQTDAWACMALEGENARDVLARLVPADLRPGTFEIGHAMRTLLGHMNALILRTGDARYEILVFRSMAATAAHEIETAMSALSARQAV